VSLLNSGKVFEKEFHDSVPNNFYYFRLKDPAQSFDTNNKNNLRFSLPNPYDCFIYQYPFFYPIELKSTQGTSMSIQFTKEEKGKMIKINQIQGLLKAQQHEGVYAGLLLNFRETEHTYWLGVNEFNQFYTTTTKKSINEKDIQEYKGILIPQRKKKVRYAYDVLKMIELIKGDT
jgi:recombination protein U